MTADVKSQARFLGSHGGGEGELLTKDLLSGCSGGGGGGAAGDAMGRGLAAAEERVQVPSLELSLRWPAVPPAPENQSVCTLEKVRSALERATQAAAARRRGRIRSPPLASSASSTTTTSSAAVKRRRGSAFPDEDGENDSRSSSSSSAVLGPDRCNGGALTAAEPSMFAAACPSCLFYVLISRSNPSCPRCSYPVPPPPPPPLLQPTSPAVPPPTSPLLTTRIFF